MATTTNYGWPTPDNTDLVKDGAEAIRDLGSSIDSTTEDLNPATTEGDLQYRGATVDTNERLAIGTAGQVLAVNGTADAPEWVTPAALPITTEGDLIVGDATGVPVRLPVGAAGEVLTSDGDTVSFVAAPSPNANFTLVNAGGTTLSGSSTTISGITDANELMIIVLNARTNSNNSTRLITFNGDTGTNYDFGHFEITGAASYFPSSIGAGGQLDLTSFNVATSSDEVASRTGGYMSLSGGNTAGVKRVQYAFGGTAFGGSGHKCKVGGGVYRGTGTISSVTITAGAGDFNLGTIFVYKA